MIQLRSILKVADNTGAKHLRVILIHGGSKRKFGRVGEIVSASVIEATPEATAAKGEKVKAIIVRTKKEKRRPDGSYIRFSDNAGVILKDIEKKEPRGTRVFGPIAREVKDLGYNKIASLASEVL